MNMLKWCLEINVGRMARPGRAKPVGWRAFQLGRFIVLWRFEREDHSRAD